MVVKTKESDRIKELVEEQVLAMLDAPDAYTPAMRMNLKLAIDYLKIKVAWEDDYGTGLGAALLESDPLDAPGENEFAPPTGEARASPSMLTSLAEEPQNG